MIRHAFVKGLVLAALTVSVASCTNAPDEPLYTAQEIAGAPEFQRNIMSDGEVTWSEYESAVIAQRDCVADTKYQPGEIEKKGSRLDFVTEVDFAGIDDPNAASEAFEKVLKNCEREYADMVGTLWAEGLVVNDADERDRLRRGLIACLGQTGMKVKAGATVDEVTEILSAPELEMTPAISSCMDGHDKLFYVSIQDGK